MFFIILNKALKTIKERLKVRQYNYLYLYNTNYVCVLVCVRVRVRVHVRVYVCVSVKYRRLNYGTDHDQIWHACADRSGDGSYLNKIDPPPPRGVEVGFLGGQQIKSPGNAMNCPENQLKKLDPPHPWGSQGGVKISKVREIA